MHTINARVLFSSTASVVEWFQLPIHYEQTVREGSSKVSVRAWARSAKQTTDDTQIQHSYQPHPGRRLCLHRLRQSGQATRVYLPSLRTERKSVPMQCIYFSRHTRTLALQMKREREGMCVMSGVRRKRESEGRPQRSLRNNNSK